MILSTVWKETYAYSINQTKNKIIQSTIPVVQSTVYIHSQDEMEFDEVIRWMTLHLLKQKQRVSHVIN